MSDPKLARALLAAAERDIVALRGMRDADNPYAAQLRYSAGDPGLTPLDRGAATQLPGAFLAWSRKNLGRTDESGSIPAFK